MNANQKNFLLGISWLIFIILLPSLEFDFYPSKKTSKIEITWKYPFQSQSYLDDIIATPVEKILSTQKYILSYETFLEYGSIKIHCTPTSNEDLPKMILKLDSILENFQKNLPREVPRYHIKTQDKRDPELILLFPEIKETDLKFVNYIRQELIPGLKKMAPSIRAKEFGIPSVELKIEVPFQSMQIQGISPTILQNNLANFYNLNNSSSVLTLKENKFLKSPSFQNQSKGSVHPDIFIFKSTAQDSEFHRLNGYNVPGISIYVESLLDKYNIYLYLYSRILKLFCEKVIQKIPYNRISEILFSSLPTVSDKEFLYKFFYSSTISKIENIYINSEISIYIIIFFLLVSSLEKKSSIIPLKILFKSFTFIPIPIILSFTIDKYIDISIVYAYSWYFLILLCDDRKIRFLSTAVFIAGIFLSSIFYPTSLSYLYRKTAILVPFLLVSLDFFYPSPMKKSSFSLRFFSFKMYNFSNSFFLLIGFIFRPLKRVFPTHRFSSFPKPISPGFLLFLFCITYFTNSPILFIPFTRGSTIIGYLDMPPGSTLSHTNSISTIVESNLLKIPGVRNVYSKVSKESVKYYIEKEKSFDFSEKSIKMIQKSTTYGFFYIPSEVEQRKNLHILDVYGNKPIGLFDSVQKIKEVLSISEEIDIIQRFKTPHTVYEVIPSREKLYYSGSTPSSIYLYSRLSQAGGILGRVWDGTELTDLRFENKEPFQTSFEWSRLQWADGNKKISTGDFLYFQEEKEFSLLQKRNGKYTLSFYVSGIPNSYSPNLDFLNEQGIVWELKKTVHDSGSFALIGFLIFFLTLLHYRLV